MMYLTRLPVLFVKESPRPQVLLWGWRRNVVLTPGYIKVIAKEIASQIITELKKPLKKSFTADESVRVCKVSCNDKDTLIDSFKDHERHTYENRKTREKRIEHFKIAL
jgi:hypothetical protein